MSRAILRFTSSLTKTKASYYLFSSLPASSSGQLLHGLHIHSKPRFMSDIDIGPSNSTLSMRNINRGFIQKRGLQRSLSSTSRSASQICTEISKFHDSSTVETIDKDLHHLMMLTQHLTQTSDNEFISPDDVANFLVGLSTIQNIYLSAADLSDGRDVIEISMESIRALMSKCKSNLRGKFTTEIVSVCLYISHVYAVMHACV